MLCVLSLIKTQTPATKPHPGHRLPLGLPHASHRGRPTLTAAGPAGHHRHQDTCTEFLHSHQHPLGPPDRGCSRTQDCHPARLSNTSNCYLEICEQPQAKRQRRRCSRLCSCCKQLLCCCPAAIPGSGPGLTQPRDVSKAVRFVASPETALQLAHGLGWTPELVARRDARSC